MRFRFAWSCRPTVSPVSGQTAPTRARISSNLATSRRHSAQLPRLATTESKAKHKAMSCPTPSRTVHPNSACAGSVAATRRANSKPAIVLMPRNFNRAASSRRKMTTPAIGGIVEFAPPRSLRHRRTKSVRLRRDFEKAEFDQEPDHSDDWDEADQDPPAGFVTVVEPLDIDDYGRDQGEQRENAGEKPDTRFGIVFSGRDIN